MYLDLHVPIPPSLPTRNAPSQITKKGKQKQVPVGDASTTVAFAPNQVELLESKLDVLVHLGYSAIALTQTVEGKLDPKVNPNQVDVLLKLLKPRPGIVLLKRLNIVLDENCDKGFGLTNNNQTYFSGFDIISLQPCNAATFSLACLTHSQPSPLTSHIISLPLTLPRLPFHLKHTLVRTAIKNGACFEIDYDGALMQHDSFRMNWWGACREVVRVTKGKGVIFSSGCDELANYRAPRDVANLMSLLGIPQDVALEGVGKTAKSLLIRAQTRKTYRAILSEPRVVYPAQSSSESQTTIPVEAGNDASASAISSEMVPAETSGPPEMATLIDSDPNPNTEMTAEHTNSSSNVAEPRVPEIQTPMPDQSSRKRPRSTSVSSSAGVSGEPGNQTLLAPEVQLQPHNVDLATSKKNKKKRKRQK